MTFDPLNVIVFGASGMLGQDVLRACEGAGFVVRGLSQPDLDITDLHSFSDALQPGAVVVNCAAYTLVDEAESHPDTAHLVNAEGAGIVARACYENDCRLIHISTDYVFSGDTNRPYTEEDATDPVNVYGASKRAGEVLVAERCRDHLIVRVQSLFGRGGRSFVRTMQSRMAGGGRDLHVVSDQFTSPTYTRHLSEAILALLPSDRRGIVHVSATGVCSWYEFAVAIADRVGSRVAVIPVRTDEYPTPARRPARSLLNTDRFRAWTGAALPTWQAGLDAYLEEDDG